MSERHEGVAGAEGTGKTPTVKLTQKVAADRASECD